MNNREWLYSLDVADLADWFDAEHVDATCDKTARIVTHDSREKLEADVREWIDIATYKAFTPERMLEVMSHWLDRQAAITAEETSGAWEEYRDATQREIAELTAERDALADDLLTCNKEREQYRELFSESLTLAAEIVNLQP